MIEQRVEIGHLGRFWDDSFKDLPYVKVPPLDTEYNQFISQGYEPRYVKSFVGSMYNSSNPMPEWVTTRLDLFGLVNCGYTFYRMDQQEVMPKHSDHFQNYCKVFGTEPNKVYRMIIMLEDWKPGHYFELDGVGYVNWKAGDWFKWKGDVPHAAANIGTQPRYTLQITGISVYTGQLNNLFAFNVPGIEEDNSQPFINLDILPLINPEKKTDYRFVLYMNNSFIKELGTVSHTDSERMSLNADGLHIYLYEPMCSYKLGFTKHTQGFYSEFEADIKPEELRSEELDSIYDYVTRNNLTNVIVHTCDYNVEPWYPYYTPKMKLVCDDLFVATQKKIVNLNEKPDGQFIYNYICLNWRFTKHRQLVATFLANTTGHLSWHYKTDVETLGKDLFFDLASWKTKHPEHYEKLKTGCDIVKNRAPFCVDKRSTAAITVEDPLYVNMWPLVPEHEPGETPSLFNRVSNNLSDFYFEAFVDIISETRYAQPTANISEKTFQAMQYLRPFVLVAPPKALAELRSLGFKTFSEFWDESYDDEFDHGERLAKIFTLINQIFSMSNQEQRELYKKMIPVLTYNLNRFKEFIKDK
jgi:hypothetical protein